MRDINTICASSYHILQLIDNRIIKRFHSIALFYAYYCSTRTCVCAGMTDLKPEYRIGDLVWHKETRNGRIWWPAMVTYEPNMGIYFRTVNKAVQYHVQFFGASPMRGWATSKAIKVTPHTHACNVNIINCLCYRSSRQPMRSLYQKRACPRNS